ncbi:Neutral/alkaline non-lysosomal ceramidase, N-terminal [Singulisphaera sp. GP187]|uniref:neutral/alkaline non-lysosomal ceramidase N-terminal domain-containing protein n=1 Tax=Singulisphaera sp. GP187 TaxID=1882752 RepID=UPI00092C5FB8|nr:neutral/alkaline non-lysosomal ceramidase N-terminal domain-containing protein [Singulisphaera sp. GP187]SIO63018.1 Neutral/alkaline non-lysosomal ceramidase, N-terminal [Singulisphaera sp. GP187]
MDKFEVRKIVAVSLVIVSALASQQLPADAAEGARAGTARVAITPKQPTWMAGYGSRTKPSEGAIHDLWAKALVLEDEAGRKAALVTLDICGIGRELSLKIRNRLKSDLGIDRDHVVLACSHTHSGPVVGDNLIGMYPMDDAQRQVVADYAIFLADSIVAITAQAVKNLEPAKLAWGTGRADFAVNRRNNNETEVPTLRDRLALEGPVDHDVPVLRVQNAAGKTEAVVFGYACHCTVLSFNQFCGDYAGFAQLAVEKNNPGAQAMFVAGCGADQNPLPRRTVELAKGYGERLAQGVQRVLDAAMEPITTPLKTSYSEIDLGFGTLPTRDEIKKEASSKTLAIANRAKAMLQTLDAKGQLPTSYPYPVQAWRLGELTWVFLGGEVVVDYSLRFKRNLGSSHTWVSSYCNDVCAYIPSYRVLKEGGYEGATSMIYYGQPTVWSEKVEEDIIDAVNRAAKTIEPAH